jgi:tagatose-6-phosphate ketose/aldose isomerase
MLELSAGQIDCYDETPLGFRHGPKSIVNADTLVVLLNSHFGYRKHFENDLTKELSNDNKTEHVYVLSKLLQLDDGCLSDVWLSFPYIVYCQALAFYKALALNVTPDNPCPSGEVNRVVQGVNIYPYESN